MKSIWKEQLPRMKNVENPMLKYIRDKEPYDWDVTVLYMAIIMCNYIYKHVRIERFERKALEFLKDTRNEHVAHIRICHGMKEEVYRTKVEELTTQYRELLGEDAQKFIKEAEEMEQSKKLHAC